jgi:hypothetical protein
VLVAKAELDHDEVAHLHETLVNVYPSIEETMQPDLLMKGRAVIAVVSWQLAPGSKRHGQFQPEGVRYVCPSAVQFIVLHCSVMLTTVLVQTSPSRYRTTR